MTPGRRRGRQVVPFITFKFFPNPFPSSSPANSGMRWSLYIPTELLIIMHLILCTHSIRHVYAFDRPEMETSSPIVLCNLNRRDARSWISPSTAASRNQSLYTGYSRDWTLIIDSCQNDIVRTPIYTIITLLPPYKSNTY